MQLQVTHMIVRHVFPVHMNLCSFILELRTATDTTNSSFAPGRHNDLPSFRASQVISSTPVDARLPHSSPTGSFFPEEDDPIQPSPYRTTDNLTNNERNPNSGRATPIQSQQALDRTTDWLDRSNIRLHSPTLWTDRAPHTGESRAKSSSEHSAGLDDTEAPLDADDAISEKILTVATSVRFNALCNPVVGVDCNRYRILQ
jgi:hypothetical protein